jgi:hypothetical protein
VPRSDMKETLVRVLAMLTHQTAEIPETAE